jgi:hypothetical protein
VYIICVKVLILSLGLYVSGTFAHDEYRGILIKIPPNNQNHKIIPPMIPLIPPEPKNQKNNLIRPQLNVPSNTLSLLKDVQASDTMDARQKVFADFPDYWAQLEKENGIDELRGQLGMTPRAQQFANMISYNGMVTTNLLGAGNAIFQAWKANEARVARERSFQTKVSGLIGLAQQMQKTGESSPGISIVVAKLTFMGKKVAGKLPRHPDRKIFTENLKAWAVNPVFDTTQLGPGLIELCRLYEDYEK